MGLEHLTIDVIIQAFDFNKRTPERVKKIISNGREYQIIDKNDSPRSGWHKINAIEILQVFKDASRDVVQNEDYKNNVDKIKFIAKHIKESCYTFCLIRFFSAIYNALIHCHGFRSTYGEAKQILKSIKLEQSRKLIVPIPEQGIRCGVPNKGNTCWLNATLQFIASTHQFDLMLSSEAIEECLPLQQCLIEIINELRSKNGGVVSNKRYDALLKEINKLEGIEKIGEQEDAPALFQALFGAFHWPPPYSTESDAKDLICTCDYYEPVESQAQKYGKINSPKMWQEITIPQGYKGPLQLSYLIELPERLTVEDKISSVTQNRLFDKHTRFTQLPNTLIFYIKRSIISDSDYSKAISRGEDPQNYAKKAYNPVLMEGEKITFTEYSPEKDDKGHILFAKPKTRKIYQVRASITHSGYAGGGHYVCRERALDGTLLEHSDRFTSLLGKKSEIGSQGYLFRLDLVGSEDVI